MAGLILDPYTLLLIFYHIDDIKTLYGSCSLVCREWYRTFFVEIDEKSSDDGKWRNLQPLHDSSFCKLLDKVVYLNRMVDVLNLSRQYAEWMGTAHYFNLYQQLESELHSDGKIIGKVLNYRENAFGKLFKKRYLTLGCYCPLVASVRNPHMAIRKLSQANVIPERFRGMKTTSCCQFLVAVADSNSSVSFYSSIDDECLLKEFKIVDSEDIFSLALTYQPLMNAEHRKALDIDAKQTDVNIYSLYILYFTSSRFKLKKYLVCDKLVGELIVKEHCEMFSSPAGVDYGGSITICGWEHFGMDLVAITSSSSVHLVTNHGIIHSIPRNSITAIYMINFTKAFNNRGFSLVDSNRYSNYSVFTLQLGTSEDQMITFEYIYLIIAQKKAPLQNEYSVICRTSPNVSKSIEVIIPLSISSSADCRDYKQKILQIFNQGKEALIHASYYEVNEKGHRPENYESFYDGHWEYDIDKEFYDYREEVFKIEVLDNQEY